MFKSFLVSMFAILLFTLGGAATWFSLQLMGSDTAEEDGLNLTPAAKIADADPVPQKVLGPGGALPAVVRGPDLDAEEMFRLSTATATKREQLAQYEERLREHKLRIKAADADTKFAQREVEGTLEQTRSLMESMEKLLEETKASINNLQKERVETDQKADDLKKLETEAGAGVAANVKSFSEFLQSMPPATSAETIKEMTNNGKMDFAIQLLRNIEPRNVAKILAEIQDPPLVAEIASRFKDAPATMR